MNPAKTPGIVLVERRFQFRLAGEFVLLQVLLTAIFAGGLYLFLNSEIQANLASAHASYRSFAQMLMPMVGVMCAFNILLSTVLVTVYVVLMARRIARPLLHVRAVLEELGLRRFLDHTGIRPGDQLANLDHSLSQAVVAVKTDMEALKGIALQLRRAQEAGNDGDVLAQTEALERVVNAWH